MGAQARGTGGLAEAQGFGLVGLIHCTHIEREGGLRAHELHSLPVLTVKCQATSLFGHHETKQ